MIEKFFAVVPPGRASARMADPVLVRVKPVLGCVTQGKGEVKPLDGVDLLASLAERIAAALHEVLAIDAATKIEAGKSTPRRVHRLRRPRAAAPRGGDGDETARLEERPVGIRNNEVVPPGGAGGRKAKALENKHLYCLRLLRPALNPTD